MWFFLGDSMIEPTGIFPFGVAVAREMAPRCSLINKEFFSFVLTPGRQKSPECV
jgi:hypothetical protein